MEATEKQVNLLLTHGYTNEQIGVLNKQAISDAIGKIYSDKGWDKGNRDVKTSEKAPVAQNTQNVVNETIVRQISVTPHSYEFGKAGARHKVYYGTIEELKKHLEALKAEGLADEFETVSMNSQ